jgi:GNAT superfamily N-acetyltransferase
MAIGRQAMSGRLSKLQAAFYHILDENNINYLKEENPQCRFGHWLFDCRIIHNNHDFLVEVQGDYIHSQPKNISKNRAKATYMERYFPQIPVKYVWEHEFGATNRVKQKVRQWLCLDEIHQIDFSFKHLTFREIPEEEATTFLAAFHYLGKLAGRIRIGAFLGNTLMAVAVWGAPTRYETAERLGCTTRTCLELRRFVIHDAYHKKNCGTFLLARMEKMLPATIEVLVSFADPGVGHEGTLYRAANWQYDGDTTPSFYYIDDDGYVLLKKTLFNLANKMHMKERDYAETYGYEKIATPPKHRFIKKL